MSFQIGSRTNYSSAFHDLRAYKYIRELKFVQGKTIEISTASSLQCRSCISSPNLDAHSEKKDFDSSQGENDSESLHEQNAATTKLSALLHFVPSEVYKLCSFVGVCLVLTSFLSPSTASASTSTLIHSDVAATTAILTGSMLLKSGWTGLAAGWLHTLSGPDHLAALVPLSIGRTKLESAAVGALWGCGHDVGQVLFGAMFVLLRDRLHMEMLKMWCTRIVGLTLIGIGCLGFIEARNAPVLCEEGDDECLQQPGAVAISVDRQTSNVATFATGIIHGLQPDALLIILPAMAFPSKIAGAAFLVMFLIGTVTAMGSYTAFIGTCSELFSERVPWLTQKLSYAASFLAVAVGFAVLIGELLGVSVL